jgi:prephenate dehydrogenase
MHWNKVTLLGVGLLGGSLGLAIKQHKLASCVCGYVRRPASIAECMAAGALHQATLDIFEAVRDAELIVLCTPIAQMRALTEQMLPALKPGTLVTDVGSVKTSVVQELEPLITATGAEFLGSHPMAGAERMGVRSARADLFVTAVCVITPTKRTKPETIRRIVDFWKSLGASPLRLTPELHDELVSRSSHLPHVVAAELSNYVLSPIHPREQTRLCANGFRDTTRIASGSPEMWRDIALANRKNLARVIGVFIDDLEELRHALELGDSKAIEEFFVNAKQRRDAWCGQNTSTE